jgi:hypothetical protein
MWITGKNAFNADFQGGAQLNLLLFLSRAYDYQE